mmetsp:Transcript_27285/g.59926  ORF Transcript_27285/g.59926 Transcript_27285/m.59926 type:complete len:218 (+) Transcript_27285:286-939(+)
MLAVALVEVRGASGVRLVAEVALAAPAARAAREEDARPVAEARVPDAALARVRARGLTPALVALGGRRERVAGGRTGVLDVAGGRQGVRRERVAGGRQGVLSGVGRAERGARARGRGRGVRGDPGGNAPLRGLLGRPKLTGLRREQRGVPLLEPHGVVVLAHLELAPGATAGDAGIAAGAPQRGSLRRLLVDKGSPQDEVARELAHRENQGAGVLQA